MAETNQTQREEELARREALLAQREAQLEKEQAELAAAKAQSAERKKTLLDNNDPNFVNPKEKLYDKFPLTVHQMDIIIGVLFALILLFLVLGMISAMFLIIIPEIKSTITLISDSMPEYVQETEAWIARVSDFLRAHGIDVPKYDIDIAKIADRITKSLSNMGASLFNMTVNATTSIVSSIYDVLLSFVFAIYLLAQKEKLISQGQRILYAILPDKHYERLTGILRLSNHTFSSFVSGQLTEAVILGVLCFIGMLLFRMPYAAAASILVGFTALIPLLGSFIGTGIGAFLILFVDPPKALGFILFIIVLQQFDGNILGPKILGETVGISSFWIVVAILVGGGFGGVLGMFLGVPVFACIHSAVSFLCESSLRKKGVTDDTIFAPRRVLTGTTTTPKGENHE